MKATGLVVIAIGLFSAAAMIYGGQVDYRKLGVTLLLTAVGVLVYYRDKTKKEGSKVTQSPSGNNDQEFKFHSVYVDGALNLEDKLSVYQAKIGNPVEFLFDSEEDSHGKIGVIDSRGRILGFVSNEGGIQQLIHDAVDSGKEAVAIIDSIEKNPEKKNFGVTLRVGFYKEDSPKENQVEQQ